MKTPATCLCGLKSDLLAPIIELKATCLALGWGEDYCQATRTEP